MVQDKAFAHKLAHELRGPLTGIKGLASTATNLYDRLSDDERREFFVLIDQEAGRLAKVADQVATLLILEADDLSVHPEPTDLRDLASAVIDDHVRVTLEPGPVVIVHADPKRTAGIIGELLDNALRYSIGPITVMLESDETSATLRISDAGMPLPPDQRESAFERFSHVRPPGGEDVPGAGLGLFLSRTMAQAQGGSLTMEASGQGGTMLAFRLPVEET